MQGCTKESAPSLDHYVPVSSRPLRTCLSPVLASRLVEPGPHIELPLLFEVLVRHLVVVLHHLGTPLPCKSEITDLRPLSPSCIRLSGSSNHLHGLHAYLLRALQAAANEKERGEGRIEDMKGRCSNVSS